MWVCVGWVGGMGWMDGWVGWVVRGGLVRTPQEEAARNPIVAGPLNGASTANCGRSHAFWVPC